MCLIYTLESDNCYLLHLSGRKIIKKISFFFVQGQTRETAGRKEDQQVATTRNAGRQRASPINRPGQIGETADRKKDQRDSGRQASSNRRGRKAEADTGSSQGTSSSTSTAVVQPTYRHPARHEVSVEVSSPPPSLFVPPANVSAPNPNILEQLGNYILQGVVEGRLAPAVIGSLFAGGLQQQSAPGANMLSAFFAQQLATPALAADVTPAAGAAPQQQQSTRACRSARVTCRPRNASSPDSSRKNRK
jgi:hypothetical protein